MTALEVVARYYDAWQNKRGDFSGVPLAEDFRFTGPVASFDTADGYRAMAREAGQAVTSFRCAASSSTATACARSSTGRWRCPASEAESAEVLEVADGKIVRGELIYDAEALRRAMAHRPASVRGLAGERRARG